MTAQDRIAEIEARARRGHEMTSSDPADATRTTRYSDTIALVAVVREVGALHVRRVERPSAGCLQCGQIWPCPTAAAVQKLGEAS